MAVRIAEKPTKDGRKYFFDTTYKDSYGNQKRYRSKCYLTKAEAKAAEAQFVSKSHIKDVPTFNKLIDEYIKRNRPNWKYSSYRTLAAKLDKVRQTIGEVRISSLTPSKFQQLIDLLDDEGYSARYKNSVITYTKAICNYADLYYGVTTNVPFIFERWKNETRKQYQIIDTDAFQRFISNVSDTPYKNLYTFLMYSGCRLGEALALRFEDVDTDTRQVRITKSYSRFEKTDTTPKTKGSIRTIPLTQQAFTACMEQKDLYKAYYSPELRIFGGRHVLPFTTITRMKDRALKQAGLPGMRIHDFRHSFISLMISNGADVSIVAHYVGHSSTYQTLQTYAHFFSSKLDSIIGKI